MVITHFINTEQILNALNKLKKLNDSEKILTLISRYSYVLMVQGPEKIFDILLSTVKVFDPSRLIGALLNVGPKHND